MYFFVTLVNDWKPLRNVAKSSILDVAGALHMPGKNVQKQPWWAIPQRYKGVEDIANQNECFDANDDDDTCDDGNSKMNSDNILTKKKENSQRSLWNSWQPNLHVAFKLLIIN